MAHRFLISVCCLLVITAQTSAQSRRPLTLDDVFGPEADWTGASVQNLEWTPDGSAFLHLDAGPDGKTKNIYREAVAGGDRTVVVEGKALVGSAGGDPIPITSFQASDDGRYFLIAGAAKPASFRYASPPPDKDYFLYDAVARTLRPLSGIGQDQRYAKLAPDATKVGFVRRGNLFVVDRATGLETQLTFDGSDDILNGESRGFGSVGWCWSPDGKRILYTRVDQTEVRAIPLVDYLSPYPTVHWLRYPKAGETNWKLRVGVLDVETRKTTWLQLGPDTDVYFPRLQWTRHPTQVAVQRLNRLQNKLELLFSDVSTGAARVVLTETDRYWVKVDDNLTFLEQTDRFVWTSHRTDYLHAYLYDYAGRVLNPITSGDWEVTSARTAKAILGVDESGGWVYFSGKKDAVVEEHVYRVRLDGQGLERLSQPKGWHTASLSPDSRHFIDTFSDVNTPPRVSLHRADGVLVRVVAKGEIPALAQFDLSPPEFLTVRTSDGVDLNAMMTRPADFNPRKKYPVIFYAYGGVSSQTVVNRWGGDRGLWHQMMTQKGFIVFTVDNRGTGGRGKAFEDFMYQNLGTYPLRDHIEAAKYLATLSYVDASRLGMWGRSGGGYLTCLALTAGSDYFKVGVAHAAVTNYLFYSSAWAERYMGLPQANQAAYDKEAVITYADKLKGHLLLVHGLADDNVQLQNTVEVAETLQAANKQFDLMYYHGRDHPISGGNTLLHLFTQMTNYFVNHLAPTPGPTGRR